MASSAVPSRAVSSRAVEFPFLSVRGAELALLVLVQPRASSSRIIGEHGGRLKIAIAAPAVEGRANEALTEFLADLLEVPKRDIELLRGTTGRQKSLTIKDVSGEVRARLLDAVKNSG